MTLVIGFAYKKRVGKNTAAKFAHHHLAMEYPTLSVKQISFADKLKQVAHTLYAWAGLQDGQYYENTPELKEHPLPHIPFSPRDIYIQMGCKVREIYGETWLRAAFTDVNNYDVVLVTDVRFRNEADYILDNLGGCVYNIIRDEVPKCADRSEIDLDGYERFTGCLYNNGTLKEFNQVICTIMEGQMSR